jgi:hypothetical protein
MATDPAGGAGGAGARRLEDTLARAHAFTEKLIGENARLRQMLAARLSGHDDRAATQAAAARERALEAEVASLREQLARRAPAEPQPDTARVTELERQLVEARRRYAELEEQNNNLANLYVASYQLHSTLDFREVIAIVMEIVINLVGAEKFCLMLIDGKTSELAVIAAEGMTRTPNARIKVGDGIVGQAARSGEPWYRPKGDASEVDFFHPLAAIPLKIKDHVIGVIAVHGLFPQKEGFSSVDYELFNLLAGHAATAVFSAKLYSESERKLTTIQSFLDLLTTT